MGIEKEMKIVSFSVIESRKRKVSDAGIEPATYRV